MMDKYKSWDDVPDHLATKTQLSKIGLKPAKDQKPAALKTGGYDSYYLYDKNQAVPKRQMSEAQKAALEQARTKAMTTTCCNRYVGTINWREKGDMCASCYYDWQERQHQIFMDNARDEAIEWARSVVNDPGAVILDTETTGLDSDDVIIEIAVIDTAGNTLLDTLVRPLKAIPEQATAIHGINSEMCQDAPEWLEVDRQLRWILRNEPRVIIYNAGFDDQMLYQTYHATGLDTEWAEQARKRTECAMVQYAAFYGEWSEFHGSFRWQRLRGGHRALGDCRSTLDLIRHMAGSKLSTEGQNEI
jgi:DNA polymerase-3 subunit epsilon